MYNPATLANKDFVVRFLTLLPSALVCTGSLLLAGCFAVGTSQAPIATTYRISDQQRMQAAHHWEILARHEAERMLEIERLRVLPLHIMAPPYSAGPGEFYRGYRDLLTSELVSRGARVSTVPAQAAEVRFTVETVKHRDRSFIRPPEGAFTTLAVGVAVASLAYNHWAEPALALIPGAMLADAFSGSWTYTGDDEVIITTQVIENQRIIYSSSNLYYINAGDRRQYAPPSGPAKPLLPILPVTNRW